MNGLHGCARSQLRTRLRGDSLLTGKITGKFEKIGLSGEEASVRQTQNQ
jgi:hypothetical protein